MVIVGFLIENKYRYSIFGVLTMIFSILLLTVTMIIELILTYDSGALYTFNKEPFSTVICNNLNIDSKPRQIVVCQRKLFKPNQVTTDIVMPGKIKTYNNAVLVDERDIAIGF